MKKFIYIFSLLCLLASFSYFYFSLEGINLSAKNLDFKTNPHLSINPYIVTSTKVFSDPYADFSFEYPSSWSYAGGGLNQYGQSISFKDASFFGWYFSIANYQMLNVLGPAYEMGFDACSASKETARAGFAKIQTYETNDPKTTVVSEVCGSFDNVVQGVDFYPFVHIFWIPGHRISSIEDYDRIRSASTSHLMFLNVPHLPNEFLPTKEQFLNMVKLIAGSIKMKK